MDDKQFHAWFSQKQKQINSKMCFDTVSKQDKNSHSCIYLTDDGKEVEITEVSRTFFDHSKNFKDSKYLGKVVKFLRSN
jgi:hypothetical protein